MSETLEAAEVECKAAMKELERMIHDKRFGRKTKHAAIKRANAADDAWSLAKGYLDAGDGQ